MWVSCRQPPCLVQNAIATVSLGLTGKKDFIGPDGEAGIHGSNCFQQSQGGGPFCHSLIYSGFDTKLNTTHTCSGVETASPLGIYIFLSTRISSAAFPPP